MRRRGPLSGGPRLRCDLRLLSPEPSGLHDPTGDVPWLNFGASSLEYRRFVLTNS